MFDILLEDNSPSLLQQIDGVDGLEALEKDDEENTDLHVVFGGVGFGTRIWSSWKSGKCEIHN